MIEPRSYLLALSLLFLSGGCQTLLLFRPPARAELHDVDFREALAFAERADAAYLSHAEIKARYHGRRVVVRDLSHSEVRYFIVFDDASRTQDIAVRGTGNLANLRVDAEYTPEPDRSLGIQLHRGIAVASTELHQHIRHRLKKEYRTSIAGHSLGGAMAAILGMYLQADGFDVARIVTFGQPKVTNVVGAQEYAHLPILRFVNRADPVADMPPLMSLRDPDWRYSHFGAEVLLWTGNRYIFVEKHQAVSTAVLSFWFNLGTHEVEEHKMQAYLASLKKKLGEAEEIRFEERNRYLD